MNFIEATKKRTIDFLENRGEYFKRVNSKQYRIRCPFCGDSTKNLNEGHLYIKIDTEDNYGMSFYCFRCPDNTHGLVNEKFLRLIDAPNDLIEMVNKMNKMISKYDSKHINDDTPYDINFDFRVPDLKSSPNIKKVSYISSRLGINFSLEDFENMGVITSIHEFLLLNNIKRAPFNNDIMNILENRYIGFISSGKSHILFRDVTETTNMPWIKYPITEMSSKNRLFYSLSKPINIFTEDDININLSEGVFDTLGVAYHFDKFTDNNMNIAVGGKYYNQIIMYLMSLGLIGNNIIINIFSDNDNTFNNKKNNDSSTDAYKKRLEEFKPVFKEINIYHNLKSKDYGVKKEEIILKKERI